MNAQNNFLYKDYEHVLQLLINKENKIIEETTIKKIQYYADIVENYQSILSQLIKFPNFKSQTSFNTDTSTYSTRLYEEISTTFPRYKELIVDLKHPFKLFVMGTGNYGKSTVINSILGTAENHAKVDDLPLTWKIDVFKKQKKNHDATIIFKDGRKKEFTKVGIESYLKREEQKTRDSEKIIKKKIREMYSPTKMTKAEKIELEIKLKRDLLYISDVIEVHWEISSSEILKKFIIVDTPGLNQRNFSGEVKTNAREYYSKSDGVLWILDATTISAVGAHKQVEELNESLNLLGGKRSAENMIGILNKIDLVSQTEEQREQVIRGANQIYGHLFKDIIPYSAYNVHKAIIHNNTSELKKSGYNELVNKIDEYFFENSKIIQCDKKNSANQMYNNKLIQSVQVFQIQLEKDISRLQKSLKVVTDEMNKEIEYSLNDFLSSLQKYKKSFASQLNTRLEKARQIENETKKHDYINNHIFQKEQLQEQYQNMLQITYNHLFEWTKNMVREHRFSQYKHLEKFKTVDISVPILNELSINTKMEISMPSIGKSTTYTALGAGMIFGPVGGVIGAGVGALLSSWSRSSTVQSFEDEAVRILNEMEDSFQKSINILSKVILNNIHNEIHQSFCDLYSLKAHNIEEDIIFAKELLLSGNDFLKKMQESDVRFSPTILNLVMHEN